jgi:hypothetical protein
MVAQNIVPQRPSINAPLRAERCDFRQAPNLCISAGNTIIGGVKLEEMLLCYLAVCVKRKYIKRKYVRRKYVKRKT